MKSILVTDYDPLWPHWFNQLREKIWPVVAGIALSIEHVGSTSVPGLAAKPIIDIDVVIPTPDDLSVIVRRLGDLNYSHEGNLGIEGREAFKTSDISIRHHLYVCPAESLPLRNHVLLRDHLRSHPADLAAYSVLKKRLAQQHPHDIESYIAGKTNFILEILGRNDMPAEELARIRIVNEVP